jgi:hypothetical protein
MGGTSNLGSWNGHWLDGIGATGYKSLSWRTDSMTVLNSGLKRAQNKLDPHKFNHVRSVFFEMFILGFP